MANASASELAKLIANVALSPRKEETTVLRGGADDAFASWSRSHEDTEKASSPDGAHKGQEADPVRDSEEEEELTTRCVLPDADPFWDFGDVARELQTNVRGRPHVILKPH